MTPSFIGRMTDMFPGVLPIILFASSPTATISSVFTFRATTDGSRRTTPFFFIKTSVLAVPKSIPKSCEKLKIPNNILPFLVAIHFYLIDSIDESHLTTISSRKFYRFILTYGILSHNKRHFHRIEKWRHFDPYLIILKKL